MTKVCVVIDPAIAESLYQGRIDPDRVDGTFEAEIRTH
ncbi:hypothetical protein BDD21_0245 [Thiocapsa rosea]|uniref:Uncharacterized protein n=1 Tax=Thiocapsa rosea TaxID=69360 RepID=A0A495V2Z2_9GAMM|nr:hypothetical protein BDD21_0245 [Thiocapsa rosea]